jgi:hypothetical protein
MTALAVASNNKSHDSYAVHGANARGGDNRDRTDDPLLAKQVLSQLSYAPVTAVSGQSPVIRRTKPSTDP